MIATTDLTDALEGLAITASFDLAYDTYRSDGYSRTAWRGSVTTVTATLTELQIGERVFNRADAISILGDEWVTRLEEHEVKDRGKHDLAA